MKGPAPRNDLSLWKQLHERQARDAHGLAYVEGQRAVLAAHNSGHHIITIFYSRRLFRTGTAADALMQIMQQWPVQRISASQFRSLTRAQRASGIAAIIRQRWLPLSQLDHRRGTWLAIRHFQNLGNAGTLMRSALSLNCQGIICFGKSMDLYAPDIQRASMCASLYLPKIRTVHSDFKQWLATHRAWQVFGTSAHARTNICEASLTGSSIIYIGHERLGLNDEEKQVCGHLLRIPMTGAMSSFNAGVAGSIILYETWRQHTQ